VIVPVVGECLDSKSEQLQQLALSLLSRLSKKGSVRKQIRDLGWEKSSFEILKGTKNKKVLMGCVRFLQYLTLDAQCSSIINNQSSFRDLIESLSVGDNKDLSTICLRILKNLNKFKPSKSSYKRSVIANSQY